MSSSGIYVRYIILFQRGMNVIMEEEVWLSAESVFLIGHWLQLDLFPIQYGYRIQFPFLARKNVRRHRFELEPHGVWESVIGIFFFISI